MNLKLEFDLAKDEWISEYSEAIRVYLEWQDTGSFIARDTFYAYWVLLNNQQKMELGHQLSTIYKKRRTMPRASKDS
jgi:hypothetical protein